MILPVHLLYFYLTLLVYVSWLYLSHGVCFISFSSDLAREESFGWFWELKGPRWLPGCPMVSLHLVTLGQCRLLPDSLTSYIAYTFQWVVLESSHLPEALLILSLDSPCNSIPSCSSSISNLATQSYFRVYWSITLIWSCWWTMSVDFSFAFLLRL